jgi:CHAT domain-containing protein
VSFEVARGQLAQGVAFVYYVPTRQGVLVWAVTRDRVARFTVDTPPQDIESAVAALESDLGNNDALKLLGQQLLSPVEAVLKHASVMVICPVGLMSRIPWQLVTLPWSGRPLIAELNVALSPGLSVTRTLVQARTNSGDSLSTLLIGGSPAEGVSQALGLQSLAGAQGELRMLHQQIPNSTLVSEADATSEVFKRLAPQFHVLHFAGHALYRALAPDESSLVLAGRNAMAASLTAREIASMDFRKTRTVILAACDTVGGQTSGTEGPLGLGKAFLVAGAGLVVGTRWAVPDSANMPLMLKMHRHAAETGDYVSALRLATLECLSDGGECAARSTWGAYVAIGSSPAWFFRSSTNRS